jgi:hypothetical protein
MKITPEQIQTLKNLLPNMSLEDKKRTLDLLKAWDAESAQILGRDNLLSFADHVYPGYKVGPHHRRLAKLFEDIAAGRKKRVIVNIAPRHGKSELISYLAPAWFLGKFPHKKVIMASHTADLAVNFDRTHTRTSSRRLSCKLTRSQLRVGARTSKASILRLVWAVRWLAGALTCSLLTTPTRSKMPN